METYAVKIRNNKGHYDGYIRCAADTSAAAMAQTVMFLVETGFTGISIFYAISEKEAMYPT